MRLPGCCRRTATKSAVTGLSRALRHIGLACRLHGRLCGSSAMHGKDGCLACTHGDSSASPEEASATGRPASDPLTTPCDDRARAVRTELVDQTHRPQRRSCQRTRAESAIRSRLGQEEISLVLLVLAGKPSRLRRI